MKKFSLAFLVLAGCAHHKPCAIIPPPFIDKMECAIDPRSNDEVIGLVCSTASVKKVFAQTQDLRNWAAETWGACSK